MPPKKACCKENKPCCNIPPSDAQYITIEQPKKKIIPIWAYIMIYCLAMAYKKMVVEYERNKIPDHLLNHTVIF